MRINRRASRGGAADYRHPPRPPPGGDSLVGRENPVPIDNRRQRGALQKALGVADNVKVALRQTTVGRFMTRGLIMSLIIARRQQQAQTL
jgi:hypothetical protein